jgi:hypothetical protein
MRIMLIKTECGIKKYNELKRQKGFVNKIRFYFFVAMATLRDFNKQK